MFRMTANKIECLVVMQNDELQMSGRVVRYSHPHTESSGNPKSYSLLGIDGIINIMSPTIPIRYVCDWTGLVHLVPGHNALLFDSQIGRGQPICVHHSSNSTPPWDQMGTSHQFMHVFVSRCQWPVHKWTISPSAEAPRGLWVGQPWPLTNVKAMRA